MERPNILFIMTDQQSRHMMSCAGNKDLSTPAMDSLAEAGTRFTRAYCTNPVCVPSRFSLFTGRMPSDIRLQWNGPVGDKDRAEEVKADGLGWTLKNGGYGAIFAGKQHLPLMDAEDLGFDVLTEDERDELATLTADFVGRTHEKPWFLVASFINPHDICYMALRDYQSNDTESSPGQKDRIEHQELDAALDMAGMTEEEFFNTHCPDLPPNFEPQEDEPEAIRELLERRQFRISARENWDEKRWRMHRWAYARLTERVDGQIGKLLDALRSGPNADNTVIIFTSDHGDHSSAHRMEHKTSHYEESVAIPMIIAQPGASAGATDSRLVSNGLDLFPTVCDYAGVATPSHVEGISLRPVVEKRSSAESRECLRIETAIGNVIVSDRYKYFRAFQGASDEQFYDRTVDPHETRNAAADPDQKDALELHRKYFAELHSISSK